MLEDELVRCVLSESDLPLSALCRWRYEPHRVVLGLGDEWIKISSGSTESFSSAYSIGGVTGSTLEEGDRKDVRTFSVPLRVPSSGR